MMRYIFGTPSFKFTSPLKRLVVSSEGVEVISKRSRRNANDPVKTKQGGRKRSRKKQNSFHLPSSDYAYDDVPCHQVKRGLSESQVEVEK